MVAHNNVLPNAHLRKDWKSRVKTWFDQPLQKKRRSRLRKVKAAKVAPRPVGLFRPAIRCPSIRYNRRLRQGRGFSIEELRAAKINPKEARGIGISVDRRRHNKSEESIKLNADRLKQYMSRLILLPISKKKRANPQDKALSKDKLSQFKGVIVPIVNDTNPYEGARKIDAKEKSFEAFKTLRKEWANAHYFGAREKKRKDKEEEEANKVKK